MRNLKSLMDLSGRVAVVTGGAGHIGRAAAEGLSEMGAHVIIMDRDAQACEHVANHVPNSEPLVCNLANLDDVRSATQKIIDDGALDIIVHAAAFVGTSQLPGWAVPIPEQSSNHWDDVLRVNVSSLFEMAQLARPRMAERGHGSIVAIGSIYGQVGPDMSLYEGTSMANPFGYGVTKGGLIQLVRYFATTYAPEIRANLVTPGGVFRNQPDSFVERYQKRTPLGRMATEQDMVGAICYFASDLSNYVTGQDLAIDGGWTAW